LSGKLSPIPTLTAKAAVRMGHPPDLRSEVLKSGGGFAVAESEQCACDAVGGVADHGVFAGEVSGDAADAQLLDAFDVGNDG
jgi:hypothetical protein